MSLLDTASLICTPNGYKEGKLYSVIPSDGSGDMSVVRATTATRVNSAGLVELVPYNWKVQSENLTLGVGLDDSTITTITANTNETLDPFGGNKAEKYNGSTGQGAFSYNFIPQNSVITSSLYVKAGTATSFTLRLNASFGTFAFATFNLTNGTVTTTGTDGYAYISSAINSVGNGWYRCILTYNFLSIPTNSILLAQNGSIYVFGWQLVEGSVAKDYQKTETRLNIPRLDYSNGTCPSLLVEPQRTNSCLWSEDFANATWTKAFGSLTSNAITSPSGTLTADKFIENTQNSGHYLEQSFTSIASTTYTFSLYAKAAERSRIVIQLLSITPPYENIYVEADLIAGTLVVQQAYDGGTFAGATIEELPNGWYRITASGSIGTKTNMRMRIFTANNSGQIVYTGDGTSGLFVWGAQLELGSYATSYIPTTSASVTRNADVISKTGISSLIGQTEGTLFAEVIYDASIPSLAGGSDQPLMAISDGTLNNYITFLLQGSNDNKVVAYCLNSGAFQALISSSAQTSGTIKVAVSYNSNYFALFVNGVKIGQDTSVNVPTTNQLNIGSYLNFGSQFIANVKASAIWKTQLTDAQCQTLTTI